MADKKFLVGVLVMALVFGMAVSGCDDNSGSGTDSALNGTWVAPSGEEMKFNNGDFEVSVGGKPMGKGTYTTSAGNNMTVTVTHVHGDNFDGGGTLESRWYTKAELKASPIGAYFTDAQLDEMFAAQTGTYSISGNTLTMTAGGQTTTYTKKP